MKLEQVTRGFAATAVLLALLTASVAAQVTPLSGCFTVNAGAPTDFPGGINFANWNDAKTALDANGVGGPCDFFLLDTTGTDFNVTQTFRPLINAGATFGSVACFVLDEWVGVSATNTVTIRTIPGAPRVVIDGSNGGAFNPPTLVGVMYQGADFVVFDNVEVIKFGLEAFCIYGETQMQPTTFNPTGNAVANSNVIRRCVARENGGCAVMVYGNSARPANTLVENNVFYNNMLGSTHFINAFGRFGHITGRRNDTTTIRQNTLYQNLPMLNPTGNTNPFVPSCMIGNNSNTGTPYSVVSGNVMHISDQFAASGGAVANTVPSGFYRYTMQGAYNNLSLAQNFNVFFDNSNGGPGSGIFAFAPSNFSTTAVAGNYVTRAAFNTALGLEANSIVGDPQFSNVVGADFTIPPSSPAVDAGLAGSVTTDNVGNPRTGLKPDAGAFEAPLPGLLAAFTANLGSGPCGPIETLVGPAALSVTFVDLSTNGGGGPITSWLWNFGDGNTSTLQAPVHTYVTVGLMTVSLTVGDGIGTNTFTAPNYVNVQPYQLKATSTGGDLTLIGVPQVGAPGAVTGFTLLSGNTANPVGTGQILGIYWDVFTQMSLTWPLIPGDPVHFFTGIPGAFPEVPFTLPAGTLWALGFPPGFALDLVQLYLTASGGYVLHTNTVRMPI